MVLTSVSLLQRYDRLTDVMRRRERVSAFDIAQDSAHRRVRRVVISRMIHGKNLRHFAGPVR